MGEKLKDPCNAISLRRLRQNRPIRELVREHRVSHEQLIQPIFSAQSIRAREEVPGLPGVYRETSDSLLRQVSEDIENGTTKFLLFGVPSVKAESNFAFDYTSGTIASLKKEFGDSVFLAVDVCLCSYTSHGQCGILNHEGDHVENRSTVSELARAALSYASAGADCVAPSDMMDGRVDAMRAALDAQGFERTLIMSYSAKFHSRFYGPFRGAADSAPKGEVKLKDRATYQLDPGRFEDARLSSLRDAAEGADILMVKPGLPYLDVLSRLSAEIPKPWAVYEVSGEYAAIEALGEKGLVNARLAHAEAWTSFVRAGASMIITYGARHAREWLKEYENSI